jgi:cytochrome c553
MSKKQISICVLLILCSWIVALASVDDTGSRPRPPAAQDRNADPRNGEQKFAEYCARCHKPPESLPRSAVPAVLRHMRVRANLPARDEQDIIRFMAP